MGCLIHKESRLNAIETLKKDGIMDDTNELIVPVSRFQEYHADTLERTNKAYKTKLKSLYKIDTVEVPRLGRGSYLRADDTSFKVKVLLNTESFDTIDLVRKELGIYETKESIGEYIRKNQDRTETIKPDGLVEITPMC